MINLPPKTLLSYADGFYGSACRFGGQVAVHGPVLIRQALERAIDQLW